MTDQRPASWTATSSQPTRLLPSADDSRHQSVSASAPLSGLAVAGLVLAFVAAPLGLVLSLIALGMTGRGRERGRSLAVGGTVVGGLGTLVILLAVLGAAANAGAGGVVTADPAPALPGSASATPPPATPAPPPATPPTPAPAIPAPPPTTPPLTIPAPGASGVGTPVADGEFTFTVTGIQRLGTTVRNGVFTETAQGEFVLVTVTVTNTGDEARDLVAGYQKLYDDAGRLYEVTDAWLALPNADRSVFENINPGNTVTDAPLLFDVPPGTVIDRIELHDIFYSAGVSVLLD